MTLGDLILSYRQDHHLSQRQFAKLCGISNGYVSMIEKNQNPKTREPIKPSIDVLRRIAEGLQMTVTDLFDCVEDIPIFIPEEKKSGAPAGQGREAALDPLDQRLNELLRLSSDEVKRAVIALLEQPQRQGENGAFPPQ